MPRLHRLSLHRPLPSLHFHKHNQLCVHSAQTHLIHPLLHLLSHLHSLSHLLLLLNSCLLLRLLHCLIPWRLVLGLVFQTTLTDWYCNHFSYFSPFGIFGASVFKSNAKYPEWLAVMKKKIDALHSNQTWDLVPRTPDTNVVSSKWVFQTKYHSDGSVEHLKARLITQGFTQISGVDFGHTFSLGVQASTVRIILALSV